MKCQLITFFTHCAYGISSHKRIHLVMQFPLQQLVTKLSNILKNSIQPLLVQPLSQPDLPTNVSILGRLVMLLVLNILLASLPGQVRASEQHSKEQPLQYQALSKQGLFRLQLQPETDIQLNTMHSWRGRLIVEQPNLSFAQRFSRITAANIQVSGGMPSHAHGLPTQPRVTQILEHSQTQLDFLVSGVKFQMWGQWFIRVSLPAEKELAEIYFKLTPRVPK